ncbi:MAG: amino acid ABC transporter permease [Lachnospiraceae bacterium]|nr:amino acid ABC transporter permease [Lachnospiraceae bacterium]MBR6274201.1 amino acid ABC transporter permease [Lachnospiraceae bacterium]
MTFSEVTKELASGFGTTLKLFFMTLALSLPLGLLLAFGSMNRFKPLKWLIRSFVYIIRGTPLLLQLLVITLAPGYLFDKPITRWEIFHGDLTAAYFYGALIAFVINYACYFSEIFRGGIENIPKGQYEAGQVLGMTRMQIFFRVILLQVIKNILAPVSNETITLVKDTSLARTVSVVEVLHAANKITSKNAIVWPLFYTGLFYLVFNTILTIMFAYFEKKLSKFRTQ